MINNTKGDNTPEQHHRLTLKLNYKVKGVRMHVTQLDTAEERIYKIVIPKKQDITLEELGIEQLQ